MLGIRDHSIGNLETQRAQYCSLKEYTSNHSTRDCYVIDGMFENSEILSPRLKHNIIALKRPAYSTQKSASLRTILGDPNMI